MIEGENIYSKCPSFIIQTTPTQSNGFLSIRFTQLF